MEMSTKVKTDVENISENMSPIPHPKNNTPLNNGNTCAQYGGGMSNDTQPLAPETSQPEVSLCSKLKTMTIEPAMFSFIFAYVMQMSTMTKMMMDKGCRYYFNYSEELCANISNYTDEKSRVEILANDYAMYANLTSLIAALIMIFIAPWSDKYGRKLPLALSLIGTIITDICILICVINFESSLFYLVLSRIPAQIFGGYICVLTIVLSHASEVSSERTRTWKYATVEISMGSGMALGGLVGGTLLRYYGYFYVYLLAIVIHFLTFMWVVFIVQETTGLDGRAIWGEKIKDFFKFDNLTAGFKASVKSRENHGRMLLFLFFLSMCIVTLTYESFGSLGFTYVHHLYDWDPLIYNSVNTIFTISGMVVLIICIPVLLRFYRITDYGLGSIGTVSMIGKYIFIAFAHYGAYVFYIGNAIGTISGVSTFTIRSGISKIVDKDELGKVFSFLATCESMLPMVGTIFLTKTYNATINVTPSVTYLMTALLLLLPLGTFLLAFYLSKKRQASEQKSIIQ